MPLSSHPPDHDTEKDNEKDIETTTEAIAGVPVSEDAVRRGSVDPSVILKHAIDGDEALKAFANHQGPVVHIDEATNKRLLRKIDMNLMPVCCLFLLSLGERDCLVRKRWEEGEEELEIVMGLKAREKGTWISLSGGVEDVLMKY